MGASKTHVLNLLEMRFDYVSARNVWNNWRKADKRKDDPEELSDADLKSLHKYLESDYPDAKRVQSAVYNLILNPDVEVPHVEVAPVVEEVPVVEAAPVEEAPVVEEVPVVEAAPVVEAPVFEEAAPVEEAPVFEEAAPVEEASVEEAAPAEETVNTEESPKKGKKKKK